MTIPLTQAALFKAGFDTAEIAQRVEWTEAEVYNARRYVETPKPDVIAKPTYYPRPLAWVST